LTDNELTHEILGCAIEVHQQLGPGLLESTHETCLIHELESQGLRVSAQHPLPLTYKGIKLEAGYRLDLLVQDRIVVELKAVDRLAPIHEAILLTYLRLSRRRVGLLINFNVPVLKDGVRRMVLDQISPPQRHREHGECLETEAITSAAEQRNPNA
jgi:GxxExxY protein